jgi:hypothetical protein
MGIRDDELNRLIKYAQGLGMSVRFKPYIKGSKTAAEWLTDGSEITIYFTSSCSKIGKILSLIHEISHMKAFIDDNRKLDPKIEEALDDEDNKKRFRKRILDMEIKDSLYWLDIYRDTNCTFNIEKLHKQRDYDCWQYQTYYETGHFPTTKEKAAKKRELRKKYG